MAVKTAPYFSKQCNGMVAYARGEKPKEGREKDRCYWDGVTGRVPQRKYQGDVEVEHFITSDALKIIKTTAD